MRYLLEFSYNGSPFHGYQIQPNHLSVQAVIEDALSTILRTKVTTTGSSRTDTGVHAEQQYLHFEGPSALDKQLVDKLNSFTRKEIAFHSITVIDETIHARFSASRRSYRYQIHTEKNPFLDGWSYYFKPKVDIDLMNDACKILYKHIDYECFSKIKTDVKTFDCHISRAQWTKDGKQLLFYISANRFLRGMVRAVVGTLLDVGLRKLDLHEFEKIILSKDRTKAGRAVPAHGLYLTEVLYENVKNEQ